MYTFLKIYIVYNIGHWMYLSNISFNLTIFVIMLGLLQYEMTVIGRNCGISCLSHWDCIQKCLKMNKLCIVLMLILLL